MALIEKRNGKNTAYRVKVRLQGFPAATASFKRLLDAKKMGG